MLLITVDTLRADRLSAYGYGKHQTPHIDSLAAEGALFEHAFCDVTWTTPSMASVMTGTYATKHGFKSTKSQKLDLSKVTLAEVLRERGYATAAVVGSYPLHSSYQLDQGFAHYDDSLEEPPNAGTPSARPRVRKGHRSDTAVTRAATQWLKQNEARPFFLWVHYFGPHQKDVDFTQPIAERWRRHIARYDGDVVLNDAAVGGLLEEIDRLGLRERTLVIFHADHGEMLGDRMYIGHGMDLYDPVLRIPLIVRLPGRIPAGVRVRAMARNIDLFPTVLEVAGIRPGNQLSGSSLLPHVESARASAAGSLPEVDMYAETYMPAIDGFRRTIRLPDGSSQSIGMVIRGIRTPAWKFVRNEPVPFFERQPDEVPVLLAEALASLTSEELYDLRTDPLEFKNLAKERLEVAEQMRDRLRQFLAGESEPAPTALLDEESRQRLRMLGYGD